MERCDDGGLLVGTNVPLPDDARVRFRAGTPPVGCTHLACTRCGATVRHFDGVQLQRELLSGDEYAQLWDAADASAFPLLRAAVIPRIRFYFCRCFNFYTAGVVAAPSREDADWACAGHPA
ncbi:MAG: hypothetical protein KF773_09490 [Deltaproteobacteria bacterium]|nr:hypothetical protein [Deltaproteobacteria bacterium]MCW5803800.1 hypothetical protein [Deltaproteobacteria bacterium]